MKIHTQKLVQVGFMGGTLNGKSPFVDNSQRLIRVKSTGELYVRFTVSPQWNHYRLIDEKREDWKHRFPSISEWLLEI